MSPLYIAAPYAGDIEENVRRAAALSRLALAAGFAPICVHPAIADGAYGDDSNPAERERGLAAVCALGDIVARAGGELWVLLRDDLSMSPGVAREVDAWREWGSARGIVYWRWSGDAPVLVGAR